MATLTYGSTDFGATLGGLPQIARRVDRRLDTDQYTVLGETHTITLTWHAVPTPDQSIDLNQDELAEFEALIVGLADNLALVFDRNDGEAYWAYDSTATPVVDSNNYVTIFGIRITKKEFPWGPAKGVTNAPVVVEMVAEVQPCVNEPVIGVGSLICSETTEYDLAGLKAVGFSGKLCACEGEDVYQVMQDLIDSHFIPLAQEQYAADGIPTTADFRPTSVSLTKVDKEDHCILFQIGFDIGGGGTSTTLVTEELGVSVIVTIDQNLVTMVITGTYKYRGGFQGVATSTTWVTFGTTIPGGGGMVGAGGPTGGGTTFAAVWEEAFNFQGIAPTLFLPPGAGTIWMTTDPKMTLNTATNTITSEKTFFANWVHDASIVKLNETITFSNSRPGISQRRMMLVPGQADYPLAYVQESGRDVWQVTVTTEIHSANEYFELPDRIPEDRANVWRVSPDTKSAERQLPDQAPPARPSLSGLTDGYAISRITQTYWVRDMDSLGTSKFIPLHSVVTQTLGSSWAKTKPRLMGTRKEFPGGVK